MRLLFITHFFPYPPTDGGRIGYFNPIKYLSSRHEIFLVSFATPRDLDFVTEMRKYCAAVKTFVPRKKLGGVALLRGAISDPPGSASKYWDHRFGELIAETNSTYQIEIAEFQHLNTAMYRRCVANTPAILREHNVEYKVWERHALHAKSIGEKLYVKYCAPRVKAFEARMATNFDRCITVSEADEAYLRLVAPDAHVSTIPSGVDTEFFKSEQSIPEIPYSMVLTGSFQWKPKQHNLLVLLNEIMPRIVKKLPRATLTVVGKGVPEDIRRAFAGHPNVTVTGEVSDVRPFLERASLVLNYLESGGGIALKVLEAMAMSKPVLSNRLGCEGLAATHNDNCYIADGLDEYATAAVLLLENNELRRRLAMKGNRIVQERYSWNVLAGKFEDCYSELIAERQTGKKKIKCQVENR